MENPPLNFATICSDCDTWSSVTRPPLVTVRYVCPGCGAEIISGPPLVDLYLEEDRRRLSALFAAPAAVRQPLPAPAPAAAHQQLTLATAASALPADRVPCPPDAVRKRLSDWQGVSLRPGEVAARYRRWFGVRPKLQQHRVAFLYSRRELVLIGALPR